MKNEPEYESLTKEEGTKRVLEIIPEISDVYIMTYENELRYVQEKGKLSIWIVGISVTLELIFLNKLEKQDFGTWTSVILFAIISSIATINAGYGLFVKIKKTRLVSHYLQMITGYGYQKSDLMLKMEHESKWREKLLDDYANAKLHNNILNLNYTERKPETEIGIIRESASFLDQSENTPSTLLVIQTALTIAFYIYLTYQ